VRAQRQAINDRRRIEALSAAKGMAVMFGMAATGIYPGEQALRALSDLDRVWLAAAWGGYSRELEREADDAGFERAFAAGYDPSELVAGLEALRDAASERGDTRP